MQFQINPQTLDFPLPEELIAQEPAAQRDQAKLMVIHRQTGELEHRLFRDLVHYLRPGDVLVLNKAKVDHAKLVGHKRTGGKVELVFVAKNGPNEWRALARPLIKNG